MLCQKNYHHWFNKHPSIQIVKGDLFSNHLQNEFENIDGVFHLAAIAKPWVKQKSLYHKINVEGTSNILKLAELTGVKKVVVTSSAGALIHQEGSSLVDESQINIYPETEYEKSKIEVLKLIQHWRGKLEVCAVSPSRVYGPGILSTSNAVTKMILGYAKGTWRFIPGNGNSIGNYVFIEDVVKGHLLAMQNGKGNENYLLGGENLSFNSFFDKIGDVSGRKRNMIHIPLSWLIAFGKLNEVYSNLLGLPPIITTPWIKKYHKNWGCTSKKAALSLGYKPLGFNEGVKQTLSFFGYL